MEHFGEIHGRKLTRRCVDDSAVIRYIDEMPVDFCSA